MQPGRHQALTVQPAAQMRQHIGVILSGPWREPLTDQVQPELVNHPGQRSGHPHRVPAVRRCLHHEPTSVKTLPMKETAKARSYDVSSPHTPPSARADPPDPA